MSEKKLNIKTFARVQITVELDSGSNWSPGTSLEQVYSQAETGAIGTLERALRDSRISIVKVDQIIAISSEVKP